MTKSEILKGNELIARFENKSFQMGSVSDFKEPLPIGIASKLKYHSDWNELIRVVIIANKICSESQRPLSNKSREQDKLENPLENKLHWKSWSYHYINMTTDKEAVYRKLINFIKWYNLKS